MSPIEFRITQPWLGLGNRSFYLEVLRAGEVDFDCSLTREQVERLGHEASAVLFFADNLEPQDRPPNALDRVLNGPGLREEVGE